jgi:hypothetical protein
VGCLLTCLSWMRTSIMACCVPIGDVNAGIKGRQVDRLLALSSAKLIVLDVSRLWRWEEERAVHVLSTEKTLLAVIGREV